MGRRIGKIDNDLIADGSPGLGSAREGNDCLTVILRQYQWLQRYLQPLES